MTGATPPSGSRGTVDLGYEEVIVTRHTLLKSRGKEERSLMLRMNLGGVEISVHPQDVDRFVAEVVKVRRWVTTGEDA